jgi:hypothetical protein
MDAQKRPLNPGWNNLKDDPLYQKMQQDPGWEILKKGLQ